MNDTTHTQRTSAEYRQLARDHMAGSWGKFAVIYLVIGVAMMAISAIPVAGGIAQLLLSGPVTLGIALCMLKLFREDVLSVDSLTEGFQTFLPAFLVYLLTTLFVILWSLLLIIPGIIAGYSYSMAYYLLADNPGMTAMEALRASKSLMRGHKMDLFLLHLTFAGWFILSALSLGIGFLWLSPYMTAASTGFYLDLKAAQPASPQDHWISE